MPFPSLNQSRGTVDGFSVTLNWELSDIYGDLLDSVIIVTERISLLEYGGRSKRQVTGNTDTVTITNLTTTQYTFTELQPFSHYCFTVSAQYAFEGQALGEVAAEPFCTNTSEAGKIGNSILHSCSTCFAADYIVELGTYMYFVCTSNSSICTTRCDGLVSRIYITYSNLDYSSITKWDHTPLHCKNNGLIYRMHSLMNFLESTTMVIL